MDNKKVAKSFLYIYLYFSHFLQIFTFFANFYIFCNFFQENAKRATFCYPSEEQLWITLDNFWITEKLLVFNQKNCKKMLVTIYFLC